MANLQNDSELVLSLITTVGTDVEDLISVIKDCLHHFNYTTEIISVSKDVLSQFEPTFNPDGMNEYDRISHYMELGNKIRKSAHDNSVLMSGVAACINQKREALDLQLAPRKRVAYIIKSIKHPAEVQRLRAIYGDGAHFLGITSSFERRISFLKRKGVTEDKAKELLDRDENENIGHGQHTQEAFQLSDYFFDIKDSSDYIKNCVSRLVELLFGEPFYTPSFDEYAMFMAYASSLRSADLSRQVGAVIAKNNEILASGVNDCPKAFGGLYWPVQQCDGSFSDTVGGRDYTNGHDRNKVEQKKIIEAILKSLKKRNTSANFDAVKNAGVGDLTEYGRVVHAEMEAILMCARNNISTEGAELFVTTFPCHNCAKHIIAAGIKRVVYIEPYPKSKTFDFYKTEISNHFEKEKVLFEPFVGVGPSKYIDLFAMKSRKCYSRTRKLDDGTKIEWNPKTASLRSPMSLLTYLEGEYASRIIFEDETSTIKEE